MDIETIDDALAYLRERDEITHERLHMLTLRFPDERARLHNEAELRKVRRIGPPGM